MEGSSDEWWADYKSAQPLLGSSRSHNWSIPGNCLIFGQKSFAPSCFICLWLHESSFLSWPRQQVRRGVSPCQLVPWINQLPSTQSVNLNCLRQETPTELIPLHFLEERWALPQLREEQQIPHVQTDNVGAWAQVTNPNCKSFLISKLWACTWPGRAQEFLSCSCQLLFLGHSCSPVDYEAPVWAPGPGLWHPVFSLGNQKLGIL